MTVNLSPIWGAGAQLFDNSGNVLSGGKIYTYLAGTSTPATTYTSNSGNTANSNPIVANSAGRLTNEVWLTWNNLYKFVLRDSNDVLIATYDNIPPILDASSIPLVIAQEITISNFVGTGSQVDFTLVSSPADEKVTSVHINGVYQQKNTYSVSGATLTFSEAPPVTSLIEVEYM